MFKRLPRRTYLMLTSSDDKRELAGEWHDAGTDYEPMSTFRDALGFLWVRIVIAGYHYHALASELKD